ncbi:helix-turn-helix domain-containing protein [Dactylosporangium sp. NPDC049140]|uniref:TetR/AcrR family transcriptional regulator n=1 Tax=Dactylosporangium sp. NPDC049140 TaxID=3155647 RepID=UPI0033C61C95
MGHGASQLRSDARQNRDRIVEVAGTLFAERGIDVPMAAVARHAGVGVATLYRRFPTREALVTEVFADQFAACEAVLDDALADPDPWHGFRTVVERVCAMQAADRGFAAAALAAFPGVFDLEREKARGVAAFAELAGRAQAAGRLRADFVPDDLLLILQANCGVTDSGRLVAYLLDGFAAR